jgi:hypothetical protein
MSGKPEKLLGWMWALVWRDCAGHAIIADKRRNSGAIVQVNYWFYKGLRFAFRILLAQFRRNSDGTASPEGAALAQPRPTAWVS